MIVLKRINKAAFGIVICLFFIQFAKAQNNYSHITFNENTGLKSAYINDIILDKNGLLWIANNNQLVMFDGKNFSEYPFYFNLDTNNIPQIKYFWQIPNGKIGFATRNYFYQVDDYFQLSQIDSNLIPALNINELRTSDIDNALQKENNGYTYFKQYLYNTKHWEYLVTNDSLFAVRKDNRQIHYQYQINNNTGRKIFHAGNRLFCMKDSNLICITNGLASGSISIWGINENKIVLDKESGFYQIENRVYLLNQDGLYSVKLENERLIGNLLIEHNLLPKEYYKGYLAVSDNEKIIIMATGTDGLHLYKQNSITTFTPSDGKSYSFNNIIQINEKLITNNATNFYWDTNGISHYSYVPGLGPYGNTCYKDTINQIFYVSVNDTMKVYNYDLKLLNILPYGKNNFINRYARIDNETIIGFGDKFDILCLGTQLFPLSTPSTREIINEPKLNIYDVYFVRDTTWFGTSHGLISIPKHSRKNYTIQLQNKACRAIVPIRGGKEMLIFTYGHGIFLYSNGKLIPSLLDPKEFLYHAHSIIFDDYNRIWIPTNRGIICTDFNVWYQSFFDRNVVPFFYYFGNEDGLNSIEMNGGSPGSFIKLAQTNKIYLSSVKGLVHFVADSGIILFPSASVSINSTRIGNNTTFGLPSKIKSNIIEILLSCPYWGNPNNLKIEYTFDDNTNDWTEVQENLKIRLVRPGSGEHILKIRYRNGFGNSDYYVKNFSIYFEPYYYETILFKIGVLLTLILLAFYFYRLRINYLLSKQKELEKIIDEKTSEIRQSLTDLSKSESELMDSNTIRQKLLNVVAHDIRSPLIATTFIIKYINKLLERENNEKLAEPIKLISEVSRSVQGVYDLASDFLIWHNLSNKKSFEFVPSEFDIKNILDSIMQMYEPIITAKGNTFETNLDSMIVYSEPAILTIILRNLIDNANKYTSGGIIRVEASNENEYSKIVIFNNPVTISEDRLAQIHENFIANQDIKSSSSKSVGLGLVSFLSTKINIRTSLDYDAHNKTFSFYLWFQPK